MLRLFQPAWLLGGLLLATRLAPAQPAPTSRAQFKPAFIKARLLQVARWQLAHPKLSPTDWTNGAFYAGVFAAYQATHSRLLLDLLLALGERTHRQPGPRYDHADGRAICQTYLNLYQLEKNVRMLTPTLAVLERLRTEPGPEVAHHGISWWWCDALFMGPPVLAKAALLAEKPQLLTLNDTLYRQTYWCLFNPQQHLSSAMPLTSGMRRARAKKKAAANPFSGAGATAGCWAGWCNCCRRCPPATPRGRSTRAYLGR